jgi:hypothetical protein
MQLSPNSLKLFLFSLLSFGLIQPSFALDPDPRQWSHLPMGKNVVGLGEAYTQADIFFDPVMQLNDVKMRINTWAGKVIKPFELFDKSARVDVIQAYQKGRWTGLQGGVPNSITRSGWSDTLVRFAINLYGAPPLSGKEYGAYRAKMKAKPETVVGVGMWLRLPTGNYMDDKLINIGQNRFVFRPQIGMVHTRGKWTTELTASAAFYEDNDEFFNGNKLEQDTAYTTHANFIRDLSPGEWASVSAGYNTGGESTLNGVDKDDNKQNIAWALRYRYPFNRTSGIKFSYISTRTQEDTGFDSDTVAFGTVFFW